MKNEFSPLANAVIFIYIGMMEYAAVNWIQTYKTQDKEQIAQARKRWNAAMSRKNFEKALSLAFELDNSEESIQE